MTAEMALLLDVASRLRAAGIEYMMTGSMAMAVYSTPRMTRDIDIIIQVSLGDIDELVSLFKNDFYIDEQRVREAVRDRGMFNAIHSETVIKVDFIVRKDDEYRIEEFARRQTVEIEGVPVSVASVEDLVLSKLVWAKQSYSELQLRDVRQMLRTASDIDVEYVRRWSTALGVSHLLSKAESHER